LTEACRSLAATNAEPERAFYRDLEGLVQPWLNPGVLAQADREILLDLLLRCRQVERELRDRGRRLAALSWAVPVLMLSALLVALLLGSRTGNKEWSRGLEYVQGWSDVFWLALERSGCNERSFLLSIIVITVLLSITARVARS
jgi:hypothetical protein